MRKAFAFTLILTAFCLKVHASESAGTEETATVNEKCPISGKAVNPKCTTVYEDQTYAFCNGKCRKEWTNARADSLYDKLGGKEAISAAVDRFYVKVLADDRINFYFDDVSMRKQHNKQKAFLSAALGGPSPWDGKDMRTAHKNLDGLNETHFNAVAEQLQSTLEELKVSKELIDKVMVVVATTRDDVLNREKPAN